MLSDTCELVGERMDAGGAMSKTRTKQQGTGAVSCARHGAVPGGPSSRWVVGPGRSPVARSGRTACRGVGAMLLHQPVRKGSETLTTGAATCE